MQDPPNSNFYSIGQPLFFYNSPKNELETAIKTAAIELSKAKTQTRISQQPKSTYLKNTYKDTPFSFMYDFYKETDIDNFKIFLENFYAVLEDIFLVYKPETKRDYSSGFRLNIQEGEPQASKKEDLRFVRKADSLNVSLTQMKELQKNMLSTLNSLMMVNQNFKGFFDDQKQLIDQIGVSTKERSRIDDQNSQGRKIIDTFQQIFESFEKSLGLIEDVSENELYGQKSNDPSRNIGNSAFKLRSKFEIAPAMAGDAESNVYASAETFAKRSDHSPRLIDIPLQTVSKEITTDINSLNLETNHKAIAALMDKLLNCLPKKKQGPFHFEGEHLLMDKKIFRFLTDLEREIRLNASIPKSPSPKKDTAGILNSTQAEDELEELRWQKSLMEDDLQYKTQALSEKIRESHDLSAELERIRAENERLRNSTIGRSVQTLNQEKFPRFSEKDNSALLKDELDKSKAKIFSLEKQLEALKIEHRTREQDQAYLDQVTQVMKERKDELNEIRSRNHTLEKQVREYQDLRDGLQRRSAKLENDLDALVRENTRLASETRELRNEVRNLQALKFQLEKGGFSNDPAVDRVQQSKDMQKAEQDRSKKLATMYQQFETLADYILRPGGSVLDDLNSQLKDYHVKKIDELTADTHALQKENSSIIHLYENKLKEIATHNADLAQENTELQLKIEALRAVNIDLEDDLKSARSNIIRLSNDQLAIAEKIRREHINPETITPEKRLNMDYEKRYYYPLYRKVSPAKATPVKRSPSSKILRPINRSISYSQPTPREFSETGGGRSSQNVSYSLSSPGGAAANQKGKRVATDPWERMADEQNHTPTKGRAGKSPPNSSTGKKSTPAKSKPLQSKQPGFAQDKSTTPQPQKQPNSNNYISITQVGQQNEPQQPDYEKLMGYTESNQALTKSPPKNTPDSDPEDDFKLFYSLNKMLKNPLGVNSLDSNKFISANNQSPIRARMVAKAISQIDSKLEVLKDSVNPKKLDTVIDEINEQYDILAEDEMRRLAEEVKSQEVASPQSLNEEAQSSRKKSNRDPPSRQSDLEREDVPSFNRDEDIYSMLATQSNVIEQLLQTSMF